MCWKKGNFCYKNTLTMLQMQVFVAMPTTHTRTEQDKDTSNQKNTFNTSKATITGDFFQLLIFGNNVKQQLNSSHLFLSD